MKHTTIDYFLKIVFPCFIFLILFVYGCAPAAPSTSPFRQQTGDPFVDAGDELKACLVQEIGQEAFQAVAAKQRPSTPPEIEALKRCIDIVNSKLQQPPAQPTEESPAPDSPAIEAKANEVPAPSGLLPGLPPGLPPSPPPLVRTYPDFIKCSSVSSPELPQVVERLDELKPLGINTICIMQGVDRFNPRINQEQSELMKSTTLSSIREIKKAGFAIVFILDMGGPLAEKEYTKLTQDQFLEVVEREALAWAALAEEYQVEYFAPANELPSKLHNFLAGYSESERKRKKIEETNRWQQQILPKVQEVFKGKIVAKLGDYSNGLDPQGYDVVAYTISHDFILNLEEFRRNKVRETYTVSIRQAAENKAEWMGNIYFAYEEAFNPDAPSEYTTKSRELRELQDDYHRIIIEEIYALDKPKRPQGLMVGGYTPGSIIPQLTDSSKVVIKNFFLEQSGG